MKHLPTSICSLNTYISGFLENKLLDFKLLKNPFILISLRTNGTLVPSPSQHNNAHGQSKFCTKKKIKTTIHFNDVLLPENPIEFACALFALFVAILPWDALCSPGNRDFVANISKHVRVWNAFHTNYSIIFGILFSSRMVYRVCYVSDLFFVCFFFVLSIRDQSNEAKDFAVWLINMKDIHLLRVIDSD